MRFTKAQVALFKGGISFVHMASDDSRRNVAVRDFKDALSGYYLGTVTGTTVYSGDGQTWAKFMVCRLAGESTMHVPVMFMDGKRSEVQDTRAYDEARWIPAEDIDGCGPMVVR